MSVHPMFFGDARSPLAGWLHVPNHGTARAAVVMCPPLGIEYHVAHLAFHRLASTLEDAGFAVLRFDYSGTGDSAGSMEDQSLSTWLASIATALSLVRSCGAQTLALVGLRLGATLAAEAAFRDGGIDALVLWDACESGRAFLREQRALRALSLPDIERVEPAGERDLVALRLPSRLAQEISDLTVGPSNRPLARAVLRLDRPGTQSVLDGWATTENLDRVAATGQAEFIDVEPGISVLPEPVIGEIGRWLDRRLPTAGIPIHRMGSTEAVVARDASGAPVRERMERVGANGVFAITTEPIVDRGAPAVLLSNVGLLHHVGPGRLWVDLARRWAQAGFRVVRFDLRGIGETPLAPGQHDRLFYPPDGVLDLKAAAEFASPRDPRNVVIIGVCSGAYHAIKSGIAFRPRAIGVVNPILKSDLPGFGDIGSSSTEHVIGRSRNPVIRWMRANGLVVSIAKVPVLRRLRNSALISRVLNEWTPAIIWDVLDRTGLSRLEAHPFRLLAGGSTDVLLICGEQEARPFHRARTMVRRLSRRGVLRFVVRTDIDHSVFSEHARAVVSSLLEEELLVAFAPSRGSLNEPVTMSPGRIESVSMTAGV